MYKNSKQSTKQQQQLVYIRSQEAIDVRYNEGCTPMYYVALLPWNWRQWHSTRALDFRYPRLRHTHAARDSDEELTVIPSVRMKHATRIGTYHSLKCVGASTLR
jgi:hypothetical protein